MEKPRIQRGQTGVTSGGSTATKTQNGVCTRVVREAGWNRAQKLLRKGIPLKLWLASDADIAFASQVIAVAQSFGVKPDRSKTGKQLSAVTGVEVFTAVLCSYTVPD